MPILKLQPNQTYRIGLKFKSATEKNGQWGKQFQYILSDGHILYLPPVAHAEVQSLNPGPDEPFTIRKTIGTGGAAVWSVERIPGEVPAPKPVAAARSISAPSDIPIPPSLTTRESRRIFTQLVATIQAAQAAEQFAASINFPVKFGPEDLRAMAISGFIEQSRNGRAA